MSVTPVGSAVFADSTTLKGTSRLPVKVKLSLAPCATDIEFLLAVRENGAGGSTVIVKVVECTRIPLLTVTVTVTGVNTNGASIAALNSYTIDVGEIVPTVYDTPAGSPVMVEVTVPTNPLSGITSTSSSLVAPSDMLIAAGVFERSKSGGRVPVVEVDDPVVEVVVPVVLVEVDEDEVDESHSPGSESHNPAVVIASEIVLVKMSCG